MSNESFDLLSRRWLPVRRRSGRREWINPAEITNDIERDPIVAFDWGRADLDVATREFVIGLLSIACWERAASAGRDWQAWWRAPPMPEELQARFVSFAPAFVLNGDGPRFLQELGGLEGESVPVSALLIDQPGANALKKNTDLFVKRGRIETLSRGAAAMALFALQAFAPSGGSGHRVSLRGGGPITCLLLPGAEEDDAPLPLWHQLWLNVYWNKNWPTPEGQLERIFPWLTRTRTSAKDETVTPVDVHPAQAFWGMPRRIALAFVPNSEGLPCDLTGVVDEVVVRSYVTRPHGISYAAWSRGHSLTPYKTKPTDAEWLPLHGQPGRLGYRDWLGLVIADVENEKVATRLPAEATRRALERILDLNGDGRQYWRLHVAGYDMDKGKARGFAESEMPVLMPRKHRPEFENGVRAFVRGAREAAGSLAYTVGQALFGTEMPAADLGPRDLARSRFYERTEPVFYEALRDLVAQLEPLPAEADGADISDASMPPTETFRKALERTALAVFDELVPWQAFEDQHGMERIIQARRQLGLTMAGYGKSGAALFGALRLSLPETQKRQKKKGKAA